MILNHKRAIEFLVDDAGHIGFTPSVIRAIHAALSENLLGDQADEGRLRQHAVQITGTQYVPTAIPQVIDDAFRLILQKASAIPDPFEQAFFAMVHLPYLQPFADVNKRTSRLAGESLRHRLAKEPLPLAESVGILRDVAQALAYAHGRGIVHRDIKPENVLLSGGSAVVADFGIAKALHAARTAAWAGAAADGAPADTLTQVGTSLGTPAYMSPEQAAGDPDVDARADLYAWGVVAYELLAGGPPFVAESAHRLVLAHIGEAPPPLASRAPDAPPLLAALVMRCLEKDPARRPQSASELLATLDAGRTPSGARATDVPAEALGRVRRRRSLTAAGVILMVGTLAWLTTDRTRGPQASAAPPVLAVLPFENVGPPGDAYFADGLTDEVRGRLAGIAGLRVIGGTSARQYKGSTKSPREIAAELGATHLLTGTVRWERGPDSRGRVRVSPELVRAADQASVWAEPVEGPLSDVFAMQTRVAERVAAALDVALLAREQRTVAARPTTNLAAYDAYLRGLAKSSQAGISTGQGSRPAIAEFERAVAFDPRFAAAHAWLARAYGEEARSNGGDPTMVANARASAARAWALDSTLVETQLAGAAYLMAAGEPARAEQTLRTAAEAAPDNVDVLLLLAKADEMLGRPDRSIASARRAAVLDPRSATAFGQLAQLLDRTYQYEDAIRTREHEIALTPDNSLAYAAQAYSSLLWRADTAAARRMLERGGPSLEAGWLVWLPSLLGSAPVLSEQVLPAAALHARDTVTLDGYVRATKGAIGPAVFHFMKLRHFAASGRQAEAHAHAESLVVRLAPALRDRGDIWLLEQSMRAALGEAYAYLGRPADAAREANRAVAEARRSTAAELPTALASAAYVEVLIGQRDPAVAHLAEALRLPGGMYLSRAVLRTDPSWAPLRGLAAFERLLASP